MQLTEFAVGIARQAIPAPRLDNQIEISEVVRVGEVRSEDPHLRQPVEVLWLRVDDRGTVDRALQQRSAFARLMRGSILAIALLALFSAGIFLAHAVEAYRRSMKRNRNPAPHGRPTGAMSGGRAISFIVRCGTRP